MGNCEICGSKKDSLFRARVEGTEMTVCKKCCSYGRVLSELRPPAPKIVEVKAPIAETEEAIVANYGKLIRNAREKSGQSQEDFARNINVRLSMLRSFENNKQLPAIDMAKRMEKQLNVKLVETVKPDATRIVQEKSSEPTLGDIIIYKKRKK